MKTVLFLLLLSGMYGCDRQVEVYICEGPHTQKYHYSAECRGLSNCNRLVVKTIVSDAQKNDRTLCGWEK